MTKRCARCGITKPLSEFYKDKGKKDGHAGYCKLCNREHCQAYYQKEGSRLRQKSRDWYHANQQQGIKVRHSHYERNADRYIERAKLWAKENPEQYRNSKRQALTWRRALQRNAIPPWADRDAIAKIYANCPEGHEVDHIVPIVAKAGGKHVACGLHCERNLQYLTSRENKAKGAQLIQELAT